MSSTFDWDAVQREPLAKRYLLVGRFICKFEAVGFALRSGIQQQLGDVDGRLLGLLMAEMEVSSLAKAYFSILHLTVGLDGINRELFGDVERRTWNLMEQRNIVAHNVTFEWGDREAGPEEAASTVKWHRSYKKSESESLQYSLERLKELGDEADAVFALVNRINGCVHPGVGFSIDRNFMKNDRGEWIAQAPE
jgi:hypothetical protein